ncbi:hypothetical protein AAF712_012411 [Marasmius tenuissimus]|uniref:Uncharacterized protein n=1 Tax=Marasmius tenuissimus TaxID=585030 RepID=A0ABR2ZHI4_9AGAR
MPIDRQSQPHSNVQDPPPSYDRFTSRGPIRQHSNTDEKDIDEDESHQLLQRPDWLKHSRGSEDRRTSSSALSPVVSAWELVGGKVISRLGLTSKASKAHLRQTVRSIIQDLIVQYSSSPESDSVGILSVQNYRGIMESCYDACQKQSAGGTTLWEMLNDKFIEGHTPMYWTMISRATQLPTNLPQGNEPPGSPLFTILLSYASPLSPVARSDIETACMEMSDHALYTYLKFHPDYAMGLSLKGKMVFGTNILAVPDEIKVSNLPDDRGFKVEMRIVQFVKRIRVKRLWTLAFGLNIEGGFLYWSNQPRGRPYIYIGLSATSAPTPLDSTLWIFPKEGESEKEKGADLRAANFVTPGLPNGPWWNCEKTHHWVQEEFSRWIQDDGSLRARWHVKSLLKPEASTSTN